MAPLATYSKFVDLTPIHPLPSMWIDSTPVAMSEDAITRILDRLGYDHVLNGARAFDDWTPDGWRGCFLARIVGARDALYRRSVQAGEPPWAIVWATCGLEQREQFTIITAFDYHREQFRDVVTRWLRAHGDPLAHAHPMMRRLASPSATTIWATADAKFATYLDTLGVR